VFRFAEGLLGLHFYSHVCQGDVSGGFQILRHENRGAEFRSVFQCHNGAERLREIEHLGLHLLRAGNHQSAAGEGVKFAGIGVQAGPGRSHQSHCFHCLR